MKLFREVGLLPSTLLVIGNVIGIGIFTTPGLIAAELGAGIWLLGVWIIGGLLALIGAVCYAVLSIQIPKAGGEYAFLYPTYGPFSAFLAGWTSLLIGFAAPIAAGALGLSHYLVSSLDSASSENSLVLKGTAAFVLLAVTLLLTIGLKFGNRIHSIVTLFNLALIVGFSAFVLGRAPIAQNLEPILGQTHPGFDLPSLATAIVMVMFSFSGWNAAAYLAEEIREPERNIPAALFLGTVTVTLIYLLINLAYFSSAPLSELAGQVAVAEVAAQAVFETGGTLLTNVLILFSILSSMTAMSIAGPRVYFAMSRNRLFPQWLAEVHQEKKIPLRSIWFQSSVALLLIAVGTLREILIYSGFILLLFATLTVSTLFVKRRQMTAALSFPILYPLLAALFVLVNSAVLVNAAISNPKETLAGLLTVASGLPVYFYYRKR